MLRCVELPNVKRAVLSTMDESPEGPIIHGKEEGYPHRMHFD